MAIEEWVLHARRSSSWQEAEQVRQLRSRIVQALNVPKRFSEVGSAGGAFPFAKIYSKGKRPTPSAVCTSSGLHSLWPCPRSGASRRAGVGRVRSLAFWGHPAWRFCCCAAWD